VNRIVRNLHKAEFKEAVKGFANIALIADKLSRAFTKFGRDLKEMKLLKASRVMAALAEEAADVAVAVDAGALTKVPTDSPEIPNEDAESDAPEDPKGKSTPTAILSAEHLNRVFDNHQSRLADGLDLYADLTGDEEMPGEEEDDELPPVEPSETEDDEPIVPPVEGEDDELPPVDGEEPSVGEARRGSAMHRVKAGRQLKMAKSIPRAPRVSTGRARSR
jgi:hypothetical protein